MLRKFTALGLTIIFFFVFSLRALAVEWLLLILLGFGALVFILNFLFFRQKIRKIADSTFLLLPIFWIGASASIIFLQPTAFWRYVFAIVLAIGFLKIQIDLQARIATAWIENCFYLSAIGIFLGIWALDFYFTPGWWLVITLFFLACLLLFWFGFDTTPGSPAEKILYTLLLSFLLAQMSWALLFWPLHFISLTAVFAGIFYLAWVIARFHLLGILSRQKLIFHSVFVLTMIGAVIVTSAWLPPG